MQSQGLSLALCLAQMELDGCGAWRVHGGGFGGTTQNFVPEDRLDAFRSRMESVFGAGSCCAVDPPVRRYMPGSYGLNPPRHRERKRGTHG